MSDKTMNQSFQREWARCAMALLGLLLIAACGGKDVVTTADQEGEAFADLRLVVIEVIPDEDRQAEIIRHVDYLQEEFRDLIEAVSVRRTELRRLNADYDATREQFREFIDRYDAQIVAARKSVTERHFALVRATTADEWELLKKADTKAMKKLVGTIQSI
jgi:TolA-binding protein